MFDTSELLKLTMNNTNWSVEEKFLNKDFNFPSSKTALKFIDEVSKIAETEQLYPEIRFHSGKTVNVKISIKSEADIGEYSIRLANLINKIG